MQVFSARPGTGKYPSVRSLPSTCKETAGLCIYKGYKDAVTEKYTTNPMGALLKYLFALFLLASSIFAQERNSSTYPYGGVPDSSRYSRFPKLLKIRVPLNFAKAQFDSAIFDSTASFYDVTFDSTADFRSATFKSTANFSYVTFNSKTDFSGATFDSAASFYGVTFGSGAFSEATFKNTANFYDVTFNNAADFTFATFDSTADFRRATFKSTADFSRTTFNSTIHLIGANFIKGMDFRQANFDKVDTIDLDERFAYPDGEFLLYWDQFKAKDSLRIAIQFPPRDSTEHYRKIEITYHKLRDNFLAQRNNDSADDAMYELAWQRRAILKEWHWILYGWFFGWGYQPWRFLILVGFVILIFAFIWYWSYYGIIVRIVKQDIDEVLYPDEKSRLRVNTKERYLAKFKIKSKEFRFLRLKYYSPSNTKNIPNRLTRYLHTLFFSASVLLGIRFKKEWMVVERDAENFLGYSSFIYIVAFQYACGIALYITFALLVKSSRFAIVKDLLGF